MDPLQLQGQLPRLFKIMGTNVPIKAATIITPIMDPATVKLNIKS